VVGLVVGSSFGIVGFGIGVNGGVVFGILGAVIGFLAARR
jgi:hypothetical protein